MQCKLTSRQHKILRATVRSYIATAEPVGSKALAENYNLGVSTATIRNDLAFLEQGGLLFQPHPSAGRVPSDSGYRVYVNDLLRPHTLLLVESDPPTEQQQILQKLSEHLGDHLGDDLDQMLARAARLLAKLSGCIALVSPPSTQAVAIRHLQLVMVDPQRVMVVVVTDAYQTHSVLVHLWEDGSTPADRDAALIPLPDVSPAQLEEELQLLSNFLSLKLRGKTLAQLQDLSWLELDREFRSYTAWLKQLITMIARRCLPPAMGKVYTSGVTELMRQPEFSQAQQVQAVVQLLEEEQEVLTHVLIPGQPGQLTVYIGTENPLESIRHCTLISSTYYRGEEPLGSVSLLGPTRMLYEQAIASVQAVASHLSNTLAQ
jgi:heat-inducible transcriptional repressor